MEGIRGDVKRRKREVKKMAERKEQELKEKMKQVLKITVKRYSHSPF